MTKEEEEEEEEEEEKVEEEVQIDCEIKMILRHKKLEFDYW